MSKQSDSTQSTTFTQPIRLGLGKICLAAAIGLFNLNSYADSGAKKMFDRIDTDGNGVVSFDEFKPPRMDKQSPADIDGDGEVTRNEMLEHAEQRGAEMKQKMKQRFTKMDLDGNDIVTSEEAREAIFYRMDKDQDGYLSPEELKRPKRRAGPRGGAGYRADHSED